MNWFLLGYTVVYILLSAAGIYSDIKSRYSWWIVVLDTVAVTLGTAGLLLYQLNVNHSAVRSAWKAACVVLIAASLFVAGVDIYDEWETDPDGRKMLFAVAGITVLFEVPCFVVSWLYAYPSYEILR